jgi:hypothetical protein
MARFRAALELVCCLSNAEEDCSQTPLVSRVSANRKQRVQGRSHGNHRMPDAAATVHNTVGESNSTKGESWVTTVTDCAGAGRGIFLNPFPAASGVSKMQCFA